MLEQVAKKHDYWVKVVYSFGITDYAEDIVQEMYLKLNKYIEQGSVIEKTLTTYVYCILRSLCYDLHRVQKNKEKVSIDEVILSYNRNEEKFTALEKIYDKIDKEIASWNWYDAKMFNLYVNNDLSQRDISTKSGIKLGSVHYTLRNAGDRLREVIGEDIEDFFNNDLELI